MTDLRLVPAQVDPLLDEDELRARLSLALDSCSMVADVLAQHVIDAGTDPFAVALASSYQDVRATVRRLRAWLAEVTG